MRLKILLILAIMLLPAGCSKLFGVVYKDDFFIEGDDSYTGYDTISGNNIPNKEYSDVPPEKMSIDEMMVGPSLLTGGNAVHDGPIVQITGHHLGDDFYPAVSPDGRYIAWSSTRQGKKSNLHLRYIADEDKRPQQITFSKHSEIQPAWSPDGKYIAFATDKNGSWDIAIIQPNNAEGTRMLMLTGDMDSHEISPAWHPKWNLIAFNRYDPVTHHWDILLREASGRSTQTTILVKNALYPKWSPDGSKLVFQRASGRGLHFFAIWTVEVVRTADDRGEVSFGVRRHTEVVSSTDWAAINPNWSPDGKKIIFATVYRSPEHKAKPKDMYRGDDVWYVNENGSGLVRLTVNQAADWAPVWAPKLTKKGVSKENGAIFFCSRRSTRSFLWKMQPAVITDDLLLRGNRSTNSDHGTDLTRDMKDRMLKDVPEKGAKPEVKPAAPDVTSPNKTVMLRP